MPPVAKSEVLPGFTDCATGAADARWLSRNPTSLTLPPGASTTVAVSLDASVPDVTQPGTLPRSRSARRRRTKVAAVAVSLTAKTPKTWGQDRRHRDGTDQHSSDQLHGM
jgi:hypothetical protein